VNGSGNGSFTSYMFDLTPNTVYYVRSYATNIAGTAYGVTDTVQTRTWVNCPSNVSDIDNNVYNVVTIGYQCWTKENLKVSRYKNGDEIPIIVSNVIWESLTSGIRCWYANDSTSYEIPYGNLYNWYAASNSRGLCPSGWHVPKNAEWSGLINQLGGEGIAGGKMKAISSFWLNPNAGATNESGFEGLPAGGRHSFGQFGGSGYGDLGAYTYWWSSDIPNAINLFLHYLSASNSYFNEKNGQSVRCLRD
jgi:uncharacterized protein (TIGR02145 family)